MVFQVPRDGLCLSTFLILHPPGHPGEVLLGHLRPSSDWNQIGAVDDRRAAEWASSWMLPSSQLTYYESPHDSARRIAREQLGLDLGTLPAPILMSDSEQRPHSPPGELHWDIGFVYSLEGPPSAPRHPAWTELSYVDATTVRPSDLVRSQADVLHLAGLRTAD